MASQSNTGIILAILASGVLIAGVIIYSQGMFHFTAEPEDVGISEMKQAVAAQLLDPASVTFQTVRKTPIAFCGELNAKNRMGGYVGFREFTAMQNVMTKEWVVAYEPELVKTMCK